MKIISSEEFETLQLYLNKLKCVEIQDLDYFVYFDFILENKAVGITLETVSFIRDGKKIYALKWFDNSAVYFQRSLQREAAATEFSKVLEKLPPSIQIELLYIIDILT